MAEQTTKICPRCGMAVIDNYNFCKNCGVKLQGEMNGHNAPLMCYCPRCGGANNGNARFCRHCGAQMVQGGVQGQYIPSGNIQIPRTGAFNATNAVNTNTSENNVKIKRYVFLRMILVAVCAVLLFLIWRDGIPNLYNAMLEPSAFTQPVSGDEDAKELQLKYDEIYASPQEIPAIEQTDENYERSDSDNEQGG